MSITVPEPPERSGPKLLMIGCGVGVVLLLVCGGVLAGIYYAARGPIQAVQEQEKFAQEWTAPAPGAPSETFAPPSVLGYELESTDEDAAFPALGIEQAGQHVVYTKGDDKIDVAVYRMDDAAKTATFDEIERRINDDDRFESHTLMRLPRTQRFSVSPPTLYGSLWHSQGWLVFVRSATVKDLQPFQTAYLAAIASD